MSPPEPERIVARNFSQAFEQMCNFIAVTKTRDRSEVIKGLVQMCFVCMPNDHFREPREFADTIETLFGLAVPSAEIRDAVDALFDDGILSQPTGTNFILDSKALALMKDRAASTADLEAKVKGKWLEELGNRYPKLPLDLSWGALKQYLAGAFRRHGIQTTALLNPTVEKPTEYAVSLSSLLHGAVSHTLDRSQQETAKKAIEEFMAEVGRNPERSQYIVQLADGAQSFFSLGVDPETAEQFRARLNPMTLFLDTNFLFGILDLHSHPQVEISRQLLAAVQKYNLPFQLRYHERTGGELRSTISYYGSDLRTHHWSRALSRAAAASRNLTGIEEKFHERNSQATIDVDEFLRPYEHFDILLKDQKILVYRPPAQRLQERTDLHFEYKDYLASHGIHDKKYGTIEHDVTLLDAARQLRSKSCSSLDAGALIVSCDYILYKFDWETAERHGCFPCVVLPNMLWQMLRPYVPSDGDFEKAFAETFALPEFRAIGSGGAKACSKMLSMLASYKDVPEETAMRLLSNDLLLENLRRISDDKKFQEAVEVAFVQENKSLLEEKAALAQQLEKATADIDRVQGELALREQSAASKETEAQCLVRKRVAEAESLAAAKDSERIRAENAEAQLATERNARIAAEKKSEEDGSGKEKSDLSAAQNATLAAIALSLVLIMSFELAVYVPPWNWMANHAYSYSIQVGFDLAIFAFMLGLFKPHLRKIWWLAVGLTVVGALITVLGGPHSADTTVSPPASTSTAPDLAP